MALTRSFKATVQARTLADPAFRQALLQENVGAGRDDTSIARGTSNVFADLGYPDAVTRRAKAGLALAVNNLLKTHKLKPRATADLLHITIPQVTARKHDRLEQFAVERLLEFLIALNQDVEIMIRPRRTTVGSGDISVTAVPGAVRSRVMLKRKKNLTPQR
jgi:predicted XRE-type DNA-binding protein